LVKADLGTKRACPSCNARFYDLGKRPIECPKCGFSYEPESLFKQRRSRAPEPAAGIVPASDAEDDEEDEDEDTESEDDEEEEAIEEAPLKVAATGEDEDEDEEAEEEEAEAESGMSVVEGDDVAIDDIEVEDDEDDEEDDLLGEVEDEEDDVSGIIDPDIVKDES
jgi:uncharacterized protein (TIGR02300 family)